MIHPKLKYVIGDATEPQGEGNKVIAHCCNDQGVWGAGFVLAISKKWKFPEVAYRQWAEEHRLEEMDLPLGSAELIKVGKDIWVANIIGQHGVGRDRFGRAPIVYESLASGLHIVSEWAKLKKASVHMPRMGAGLAGGDWKLIETIVIDELCERGVEVTVYDLPSR